MITIHLSFYQYIKIFQTHSKANPWKKKSFPLFDDIAGLVEGVVATGESAFNPARFPSVALASDATSTADENIDPSLYSLDYGEISSQVRSIYIVNITHLTESYRLMNSVLTITTKLPTTMTMTMTTIASTMLVSRKRENIHYPLRATAKSSVHVLLGLLLLYPSVNQLKQWLMRLLLVARVQ